MGNASIKKNTVYNIIKTASSILFPIITFPYISRVLQPDNIGKINFGSSIVGYISLLATLGVTTYAIRECSKVKNDREELGKLSGEILSINLFTTFIAYLVLAVLLLLYGKLRDYRLLILIQSMSVIFTTLGADWLNTAMEDFRYITIRSVAFQVISVILMFVFVREPDDYLKYAIITVLSSSGSSILNIIYRRRYCRTKFTLKCNFKKHLPPILGLFAMLLAQQIFTMSDTTIIGLTLGDYQVGLYSTAVKIYNILNQIMNSITWVVMAQMSLAYAKDDITAIRKTLKYVIQYMSVLGIPCAMAMFVLSKEIVAAAGGSSYLECAPALKLLSIALAVSMVSNYVLNINLLAACKDKICLCACAFSAALNLVTNLIFIPKFGINAAAITTIFSQVCLVIFCLPFLQKGINKLSDLKEFVSPIIGSAVILVVILFIKKIIVDNSLKCLFISFVISVPIYFLILLIMKNEFVWQAIKSCTLKWHNKKG